MAAGSAVAQPMEVVTVEAARSTRVGQSTYGVPIREITIRSRASCAGLDPTSVSGALELENRIKAAVDGAMIDAQKVTAAKRAAAKK
jgi:hypothetical protein